MLQLQIRVSSTFSTPRDIHTTRQIISYSLRRHIHNRRRRRVERFRRLKHHRDPDPRVEVRHHRGHRDDEEVQRLPPRAPVLRVLGRVVRLRPEDGVPVGGRLELGGEGGAEFDAGFSGG